MSEGNEVVTNAGYQILKPCNKTMLGSPQGNKLLVFGNITKVFFLFYPHR